MGSMLVMYVERGANDNLALALIDNTARRTSMDVV